MSSVEEKLISLRINLEKILQEKALYIKQISDLKNQNQVLSEKINELQNNINNQKKPVVAENFSDENTSEIDTVMMKQKIDELVRDIDKCMLLLTKE